VESFTFDPTTLGIESAPIEALAGGDSETNAHILRSVLEGEAGARGDVVAINAAAALFVAGIAGDMGQGLEMARDVLKSGQALRVLERYAESSRRQSVRVAS
jgi:anthranilate phosphoribosyltransferase